MVVLDLGPETKNIIIYLWKKYKIKHIRISTYNLKANSLIKISYKLIVQALQKLIFGLGCG